MAKKKKSNSFLKIILMAFLIVFVVFTAVAATAVFKMFGKLDLKAEESVTHGEYVEVTETDDTEVQIQSLQELRDANDLSTILMEWSENTDNTILMRSKNVINVLLIGVDASGGLADSIIIASLNRDTKQIFLTSIMRDSYTYMPIKGHEIYGKINSAYNYGGAQLIKSIVERNYKIDIDYYVTVSYSMFEKLVDTMGGIEVKVQQYEARAVENIIRSERKKTVECPYSEGDEPVLLNGELALNFCRIRYCDVDADISRTRRQRQFIQAVINKSKTVSVDQLDDIISQLSEYVRTDISKNEIATLGAQALINRWYDYEIVSNSFPQEEERLDYSGNSWVWIVDYPLSAYNLHNLIYGESNIILAEDRVSAIDIMRYGNTGTANP